MPRLPLFASTIAMFAMFFSLVNVSSLGQSQCPLVESIRKCKKLIGSLGHIFPVSGSGYTRPYSVQ